MGESKPVDPPFRYRFRIGYAETDQMGFLHHARFAVHMESARTELLRSLGETYKRWEAEDCLLPLVGLEVQFASPGRYDDLVDVETVLVAATRLRLEFAYVFRRVDGDQLLARGTTRHVFMGRDGRPRRIPPDRLALLLPTVRPSTPE